MTHGEYAKDNPRVARESGVLIEISFPLYSFQCYYFFSSTRIGSPEASGNIYATIISHPFLIATSVAENHFVASQCDFG